MSDDQSLHSAMRAHNLESLPSDEFKSHPLWPSVFEWLVETPSPLVTWDIPSDFFTAVDALQVSEFEKAQHRRDFNESELLRRAMGVGPYHPGDHATLYHAAEHRLGGALCYSAGVAWLLDARREDGPKDLAASLRHDGLVTALEAWLQRPDVLPNEPFDAKKELPWVCKVGRSGADGITAKFFMSEIIKAVSPSDMLKGIVAAEGNAKRDAAKLKKNRAAGMKPQVQAEFIGLIEHLWVPWALWCKPKDEILLTLQPGRKADICVAWEKIARNISALGFAASWVKNE